MVSTQGNTNGYHTTPHHTPCCTVCYTALGLRGGAHHPAVNRHASGFLHRPSPPAPPQPKRRWPRWGGRYRPNWASSTASARCWMEPLWSACNTTQRSTSMPTAACRLPVTMITTPRKLAPPATSSIRQRPRVRQRYKPKPFRKTKSPVAPALSRWIPRAVRTTHCAAGA